MVILVNENDEPIGSMQKMRAHKESYLHRAFSVFIFNSKGKLLLQQRALDKYHTPGLWTNSCCSHPRPKEDTLAAANRRLKEEMGMTADLSFVFKFKYKYTFDNKLTEHEVDHVFIGFSDDLPSINKEEVNDYKYMSIDDVKSEIVQNPNQYTAWFKIIMEQHSQYFHKVGQKLSI